MAFSSAFGANDSIEQTTVVCHLCEIEPKLKWKCRECNLLMCQRCKDKVHPKFPSASNHAVIDIKDIGKDEDDEVAELIFTNLKCQLHTNQNCCLFCNSCHEIVCPTCFAKSHTAHNLTEIKDGYNKVLNKMRDVDKTIDQQIANVSINQEKLNEAKFVGQINNVRATKEIESQEEALLKAVKRYKDKILTDLRQTSKSLFLSFEEESKHMKRTRERLMEQKLKVNEVIQSKDLLQVFGKSKDLANMITPKVEVKNKFDCFSTFISGKIENISEVFGSVQEVKMKPNLKLQVKRLFQFDMDSNYVMEDEINIQMVLSDFTLWISNQVTILNLKLEKDSVNILFEVESRSNGMAVNSSGDILLTDGSSTLKLLCKDNKQILPTGFEVSHMKMTAVHVSYNKDIIVAGFLDQATKLVVMNQTAEVKKEYQIDNNKKLLFTVVICITSNHRNSIGIIDITCEGGIGRVLIIGQDSNTVNIYTGHTALKRQRIKFKPYDIVSTALDNFVVLDKQNKLLHILNNEGQAITFFQIEQLITESPNALCVSGTSHLYIACDGIKSYAEMSVYSVDISGW